ncbi:MAG: transposase [Chloroflexi bacterium]|nr:transposase [Chloroflexota bacterium]
MSKPISLEPGLYYHIYNRGTNRENIFIEQRNYAHFLKLYGKYIEPIADTYAYCLLRNHFHLLVRIKLIAERDPKGFENPSGLVQDPSIFFSNFFNAYAKSINLAYNRTGSLFQHPFGRIEIKTDEYFAKLVTYIHQNPQKHGLIDDFREWAYSSYNAMRRRILIRSRTKPEGS